MPSDLTIGSANDLFATFFSRDRNGKHVTRAVFVDVEATVCDEVRTDACGWMPHPKQIISGKKMQKTILHEVLH